MSVVLDSNIIIDALNGHPRAFAVLRAYPLVLISKITWIEVLVGIASPKEQRTFEQVIDKIKVIELTDAIAKETIRIRRERRKLRLPDAIIWATARVQRMPLITRNTRDFSESDPFISIPYRMD